MFRPLLCFSSFVVTLLTATPAQSQEAETAAFDLSGEVGLVSDYRFRGISLSGKNPAVQGGLMIEHKSGAYAGIWASSLDEDDAGASTELDAYAGYAFEVGPGFDADIGVNYYAYPSHGDFNYFEGIATFSYLIGPATPKLTLAYAPSQKALEDDLGEGQDNVYAALGLDLAIPGTPITLAGQIGYETGAFDGRDVGGKVDWQLGGTAVTGPVTLGLAYVDSNARIEGSSGGNLAGAGVVASVVLSF
jgi:uncharacterized protein (TIGR02001 family)